MSFVPVDSGVVERVWYLARDSAGAALTGVTDLRVAVMRSDGQFLDFSDSTFKTEGAVVTLRQTLVEASATGVPGLYYADLPVLADALYLPYVDQSPGTSVSGLPGVTELRVGQVPTAAAVAAVPAGVWARPEGTPTSGTMGFAQVLQRKWITNRNEVDTTSSGRERLWDDDGTTVLYTWTLRDGAGAAITAPTGSPARRGAAT